MSRTLQAVMALATAIFLAAPALSQAANTNEQDAEVRFGIQLTAALNNDREAQFLVAQMYEQGVGTPQNLRMAHLWYTKSAKQGYAPAVEKLDNWEKARQESESLAQERAEQQKRRQAEAEAAAAAKAAREEAAAKAAREQRAAEEQKRRQAEAAAKAAREEAAAKAAREQRAAEEQKRRQAEAAAATAKAASEEAAKPVKTSEPPPVAKDAQSGQPKDKPKETAAKSAEKSTEEFRANPCNTPTAKFTSICQ
ncbi:MAG: SEL1-like repeat protein [Sulfuricaulis sp.]